MTRIPMKGERRADMAKIAAQMDEALPRMLRDLIRLREEAHAAGEPVTGHDREIGKIEGFCRQRGIDPAAIHAEFEQQRKDQV